MNTIKDMIHTSRKKIMINQTKLFDECPECENPYLHNCTDGSQFCDECNWGKQ